MTRDINIITAIFQVWWIWVIVAACLIRAVQIVFGRDKE